MGISDELKKRQDEYKQAHLDSTLESVLLQGRFEQVMFDKITNTPNAHIDERMKQLNVLHTIRST